MDHQYQLCFYSGSLTGKIFPIVKEETKIGRDVSCDIVLTENSVSRIHAALYVQQNGSVVLVDNNSTNGTVVNNYQISAPVQLTENDVIGLGGEVMMVFQKASGYEPGAQWNSTDMPAGNAPESYNFENKQGSPMSNENNNFPNDGANGYAANGGQDQQPAADNYGFNQAYNMNYGNSQFPAGQPQYGFNQPNQFASFAQGMNQPMNPMGNAPVPESNFGVPTAAVNQTPEQPAEAEVPQAEPSVPATGEQASQQPSAQPQQIPFGNNTYFQQPMMGQMPYGSNPYGQQPMMGQMPYGNNPYGQQPMMGQQMPFGGDPNAQQPMMGQQMPFGADPYNQQQAMGQQAPYGGDPYSQQQAMGQQAPYGGDPYSQQQAMGQQMPYGGDPYSQQQAMGQQMPYGNNPYGQQQYMGQQMPYGNNPYAQQQYMGAQAPQQEQEPEKKSHKKLFIILGIVLVVLILIAVFIFYVDSNRLWCDYFPFLWDADTCANYTR